MAIRDRFRRALHKSTSSSNVSQASDSNRNSASHNHITTTTTAVSDSSEGSSLRKSPSAKLFPWRSSESGSSSRKKEEERQQRKAAKKSSSGKPVHPRDKPLTATNLRHQEMLSGFNMTFGSSPSRLSQLVPAGPWDDYEGVSPCCTRSPSLDGIDPLSSHEGSSTSLGVSDAVPPPKVNASADY